MTSDERRAELHAAAQILARKAIEVCLDEAGKNPLIAAQLLQDQAEVCRRAAPIIEQAAQGALNRIKAVARAA